MTTLSVILITKNAADDLPRCLESVSWADEIIVLDSGSSDDTVAIAQRFTTEVMSTDWPGFGPQKNRALARAKSDWVLAIDADEWLDPKLINEIRNVIENPQADAYAIPRCSKFCGRFIKHGAWGNDFVVRLFKRAKARFSDDAVHEKLIVNGSTGKLKHWLWHDSAKNLSMAIEKMNAYSSLSAQKKAEQQKTASLTKAILRGTWTFIKAYFFKLGFLDGRAGFILSFITAEGSYYRYLKLQELTHDPKNH